MNGLGHQTHAKGTTDAADGLKARLGIGVQLSRQFIARHTANSGNVVQAPSPHDDPKRHHECRPIALAPMSDGPPHQQAFSAQQPGMSDGLLQPLLDAFKSAAHAVRSGNAGAACAWLMASPRSVGQLAKVMLGLLRQPDAGIAAALHT